MRIILGSILAIILVVVVAIVAIPLLVSTEWIRDQVVAAVNDKTGRTLEISGDTSLSVFPELSLTVGHVAFSNPAGHDGNLVRMDELDVGLKLLPLISGSVEVDRLILDRPNFALEISTDGQPNWNLGGGGGETGADRSGRTESTDDAPDGEHGNHLAGIEAIELGDVRIVSGTFSYADKRTGSFQEASDINASLELSSLSEPLKLSGTLVWLGEAVTFATELAEPQALTTGTPTNFSLSLDSPKLKTVLTGSLTVKDGFVIDGELDLSTPSVREAGRWLGAAVPDVAGLGPFSVKSSVKADETGIALESAALALDDITAEGGLLVATGGTIPLIRATLAASRINLDNYLGGGGSGTGGDGSSTDVGAGSGPSAGSGGWSDAPIDVSGLRQIDADVRVSAAGLTVGGIEIGQSALAVTLKDALLSLDLSELQLYEGRAAGKLTVNAAGETPAIAAAFNIDNIAARPLLTAATGIDWLDGRGRITGSLASRGATQRALVGALAGEAAFAFINGSIRGINIAGMVRNLQVGNITGWNDGEAQKTDFSELSASFTITRGIAQTNDIQMLSPLVRLTGAGVADLPNRTLDFRINPKIVASLEGQGGANSLAGLEIPILIRGPWSDPQIAPDAAALLNDPSKTIDAVGEVVKDLTGKDVGGALKDAVGDPGKLLNQLTGDGQGGGQPAPMAEDLFKQLLGQ